MLATQNKVTLSDNLIDLPTHKTCSNCGESKLLCDFYKKKNYKYGVRSECKQCIKEYYQANKENLKEYKREYREANKESIKEYREANKKRIKENNRVWREANKGSIKEYREANKERRNEYVRVWRVNNPDKVRSFSARRRAAKKNAFPIWARTGEIKQQIDAIYKEAKDLELFHSESYHVDHIHPLQSNFICGLHLPANLRPLPGRENVSKNNLFTPYIENSSEIAIDLVELNKMVDHFLFIETLATMYIYVLTPTFLKLL